MGANKLLRRTVLLPTMILPKATRAACYGWVKGRHEFRKLRQADYVIVSFPQSGRTWLRTMLTRFFQKRYGIDEMRLLGLKNLNKLNPQIPKILFTHDHYIRDYTGHRDSKIDFADKKLVLLVRDPRDTAVSSYHSLKYRPNPARRRRGAWAPPRPASTSCWSSAAILPARSRMRPPGCRSSTTCLST